MVLKAKSHPRPIRFDKRSDEIVKLVMARLGLNNYNLAVNLIIHRIGEVDADKARAIEEILKTMRDKHISMKDLE